MSDEKVTFNADGNWQFGRPLQEMDVRGKQHTDGSSQGATFVPPPQEISMGKAKKTPGIQKFDLSSLRRSAGIPADKVEPKEELTPQKEEEKPAPPPPVVEPEIKEQPVQEAPTLEPSPEEKVQEPTPPVEVEEPVVELSSEKEPVPPAPQPQAKPALNLQQIGLKKGSITTMNLNDKASAHAEPVEEVTEKAVAPVIEEAPVDSQAEAVAMDYSSETPFEVVPLSKVLGMLHTSDDAITHWMDGVVKAYVKMPTAIFQCGFHPNLRVYSMVFGTGRRANVVYLTLGVGKTITLCAYDGKRKTMSDASAEISVEGTCAVVAGTPVASCSQRDKAARSL